MQPGRSERVDIQQKEKRDRDNLRFIIISSKRHKENTPHVQDKYVVYTVHKILESLDRKRSSRGKGFKS